jgi:cytochrome b6-f complex iron-sulfur subunit
MTTDLSRRHFLKVCAIGAAASAGALGGCSGSNSGGDPESFGDVAAGNVSALQSGSITAIPGEPVFVGLDSQGVYAMTTTCTHAGCDLASGSISSAGIMCPCHGSQFSLDGAVLRGPASSPLTHYAVDVATDGSITVHGGQTVDASVRTPA